MILSRTDSVLWSFFHLFLSITLSLYLSVLSSLTNIHTHTHTHTHTNMVTHTHAHVISLDLSISHNPPLSRTHTLSPPSLPIGSATEGIGGHIGHSVFAISTLLFFTTLYAMYQRRVLLYDMWPNNPGWSACSFPFVNCAIAAGLYREVRFYFI